MPTSADIKFADFERAAGAVLACLQQIPEFANLQIAVVGGLAVQKLATKFRATQDVDFLINHPCAPTSIKTRLQTCMPHLFKTYAMKFVYCGLGSGHEITINMIPPHQFPYIPASMERISAISPGFIPYIGDKDLLVFKIWSCGIRWDKKRVERDVRDIKRLVKLWIAHYPIKFSGHQLRAVRDGRPDLIKRGKMSKLFLDRVLQR